MTYAPLPFYCLYLYLTLRLSWHDWRSGLLPDRLTCPLLWCGVLYYLCLRTPQLPSSLWGAIAGYSTFALIYWGYRWLRHQEGLGYGDVKLLAALGAWHGWQCLPALVLTSSLLALLAVGLMARYKHQRQIIKNPLPFGPFLVAAGYIMVGLDALAFNLNL